jgi:hypothetical protein
MQTQVETQVETIVPAAKAMPPTNAREFMQDLRPLFPTFTPLAVGRVIER